MPALHVMSFVPRKRCLTVPLLIAVLLISACGGGGGGGGSDSAPPANGSPVAPPSVTTAPDITAQPQSITVDDGQPATFTVVATGTGTLTYQWKRDGTDIPGATSSTYSITSASLSDNGAAISIAVSNAGGTSLSLSATLTVQEAPPAIVSSPGAISVQAGTSATLQVIATGTNPLHFQWRKSNVFISGATDSTYTIAATTLLDGGVYDVVVSNNRGMATSQPATLQIDPIPNAVTINSQPQSVSAAEGDAATFSVSVNGTGPMNYQWFRNGAPVDGGYDETLTVTPVTALNNGDQYSVRVSNNVGQANSGNANLTVANGAIHFLLGSLGGWGNIDDTAERAKFTCTRGVVGDNAGNYYVTDGSNHTIRKVSASKVVTTFVGLSRQFGSSDGTGANARFHDPAAITIDQAGNLYVADTQNQLIRKITSSGTVTTLAGSAGHSGAIDATGSSARFNLDTPFLCSSFMGSGIAADTAGNIYVADTNNHAIRKITQGGVVTTFAGALGQTGYVDGSSSTARFNRPTGLTIDSNQNIYVLDGSAKIRKILPDGTVSSLPGTLSTSAGQLAIDKSNDELFYAAGSYVFKYTSANAAMLVAGNISSFSAKNGIGSSASFDEAGGLTITATHEIIVADEYGLRKINAMSGVSTFAGNLGLTYGFSDGPLASALFNNLTGMVADTTGNLYFTDRGNRTVRMLSLSGMVTTVAGIAQQSGDVDGPATSARFNELQQITIDAANNLYVSDSTSHTIRKIATTGAVSTIAGLAGAAGFADGSAAASRLNEPSGLVVDSAGNLFFADKKNHVIRKISNAGAVSTFAGLPGVSGAVDGADISARFNEPDSLAIDSVGNIYVTERSNFAIRKITPAGLVSTYAGSMFTLGTNDGAAATARFGFLRGLAIDINNDIFAADQVGTIRKISSSGVVTTVVGNANIWGLQIGDLPGSLDAPIAVAIAPSPAGTKLFVASPYSILTVTLP